nr:reverse transcriptase domain-containing protein [Tanacetum cinerariifolium]
MTNLRNEISNFKQRFDELFHEAWDRYKDILHACPHHGFTELHQLDTFYNALITIDQDSLNFAAGGNLLERRTQDVLTIIKHKSKVRNSQNRSIVSQVKSSDANSSSSSEIAELTHAVNQQTSDVTIAMNAILKQFQATPPLAFVKAVEEIFVACGAVVNYNQGNSGYRPPVVANQIRPPGFAQLNVQNNQNRFSQPQGYNRGNNFNQDSSYQAPIQQNQVVPLSELEKIKKMNEIKIKAMQTQINNVKNELRNEMKTLIQASMSNQTNEVKNMMASFFQINTASTLGSGPLPSNTIANLKGKLKAITTQIGLVIDGPSVPMPHPFINPEEDERAKETLTELDLAKCIIKKMLKALLSNKEKLLELANTPLNENCSAVILKKLLEKLGDPGNFSFRVDYLEDLFVTNHLSGNPTFSSHSDLTSLEVQDDIFDSDGGNVLIEKLLNLDSIKDLPPPHNINPLSGSTTSSSNHLLEEFADELALITFPPRNDDLPFDIKSDLREIEYLLNHDPVKEMDSILKDSVDEDNLADPNDNLVDNIPEMFTDEHALDYSSPPLYDEYDDDLFKIKSDNDDAYSDPFDSKEEKINESKLLIDELDLPRSSDFLLSPDNVQVITDKNVNKIAISNASLILEDFDPPLYELPFHKEVPVAARS